jgi:hypothetical protein
MHCSGASWNLFADGNVSCALYVALMVKPSSELVMSVFPCRDVW